MSIFVNQAFFIPTMEGSLVDKIDLRAIIMWKSSDRVSQKEWKSDRFAQVVGKDYIT